MKKIIALLLLVLCAGCSVTGPYTGTKYEIGYNDSDGVYLKAKPLVINKIIIIDSPKYYMLAFLIWVSVFLSAQPVTDDALITTTWRQFTNSCHFQVGADQTF